MSERKLASVQKIAEIKPIEGADAIEAVRVNGWWVVAKKSDFKEDDWCVYFEIDSWVPTHIAPFLTKNAAMPKEFNGVQGERLRTIKLRGQISQGLVIPVSAFTEFPMHEEDEGKDVTEILGVQKWEMPISPQLAGQAKGYFPPFIRKTDEERIQNLGKELREAVANQETFEVTLKLDGSSVSVYFKDGNLGICSRNIELKISEENSENSFIKAAQQSGLFKALVAYGKNIAVQGELMGPGVQGNREGFSEHCIFVFNIWDIDQQRYLLPNERSYVIGSLKAEGFDCKQVPTLEYSLVLDNINIEKLLEMAEGPSINNPVREGLVFKSNKSDFSFKVISNKYLLKEK